MNNDMIVLSRRDMDSIQAAIRLAMDVAENQAVWNVRSTRSVLTSLGIAMDATTAAALKGAATADRIFNTDTTKTS